jgi:hypothetical protein
MSIFRITVKAQYSTLYILLPLHSAHENLGTKIPNVIAKGIPQ